MPKRGIIYILLNPSFIKFLKIGKTQGTSEARAKEIYRQAKTGIPSEFVVAYDIEVSDCDLVERLVHKALHDYRINEDREFFSISLKDAVAKIEEIIKDLERQKKLEFPAMAVCDFSSPPSITSAREEPKLKELNLEDWWSGLSFVWQQIFRNHLKLSYNPNELDILRAVHSIIDNCQEDKLRQKVSELIKDKKFTLNLLKWYNNLSHEKLLFNSYLPYSLSKSEIDNIFNLTAIDCSNNIAVIDLKPLELLSNLISVNLMNTRCTDLIPLKGLSGLKEIMMNFTPIASLQPINSLTNLEKILCHETDLSQEDIDNFKEGHPNCEIVANTFMASSENSGTQRKK